MTARAVRRRTVEINYHTRQNSAYRFGHTNSGRSSGASVFSLSILSSSPSLLESIIKNRSTTHRKPLIRRFSYGTDTSNRHFRRFNQQRHCLRCGNPPLQQPEKKKSPNGFPLPLPCITSLLWAAPFKRAYLLSPVTPTNSQVIRMCFWNLAETTAILTGVPFQNDRRHTMNRILH